MQRDMELGNTGAATEEAGAWMVRNSVAFRDNVAIPDDVVVRDSVAALDGVVVPDGVTARAAELDGWADSPAAGFFEKSRLAWGCSGYTWFSPA